MKRICSLALFLTALPALAAAEQKPPRSDLYGDPLPHGAIARLGTIRLRHAHADVVFSKDGKQLISCDSDGEVRVWDAANGKLIRRQRLKWKPTEKGEFTIEVVLSPGGALAAVLARTPSKVAPTFYLCDTGTGAERGRLAEVDTLAFSADGKMLAVQRGRKEDWSLQLWSIAADKIRFVRKIATPQRQAELVFAPSGQYLAGRSWKYQIGNGDEDEVRLWNAATGAEISKDDRGRTRGLSLAFSPDIKTLAVGSRLRGQVRLLNTSTFKERAHLSAPTGFKAKAIRFLAYSPDGRRVAAAYDSADSVVPPKYGVLLWDLVDTDKPRRLPESFYLRLVFAPDGKTLACFNSFSSEIRLWDADSGRRRQQRPGHGGFLTWGDEGRLAASPDGKLVASSSVDGLNLWNAATGKSLPGPWNEAGGSCPCFFSPDSKRLLAARPNATLQTWDITTGKELRLFETRRSANKLSKFLAAGISADGKRLTAILYPDPSEVVVWDAATGKELSRRPYKLVPRVTDYFALPLVSAEGQAAIAPEGDSVSVLLDEATDPKEVSWRRLRVVLEEAASGTLLAKLPKDAGLPVVFSPQGRLLAAPTFRPKKAPLAGDEVTGLSLIETVTGEEILRLDIGSFDYLAFTADGRGAITADRRSLCVWDTDTGERIYRLEWPEGIAARVQYLIALPGGRVATALSEGDILVWDLTPSTWPARKPGGVPSREDREALWSDLAGDARKAHRAILRLSAAPQQTIPLLNHRLRPVAVDTKRIEKLLAELEGDDFARREAASRELAATRYRVEPLLRQALEGKPSLEMRRRLQDILAQPKRPPSESLRMLRALPVLERIGTPEARRILEKLSGGADAPETRAAQAALQRLKRR